MRQKTNLLTVEKDIFFHLKITLRKFFIFTAKNSFSPCNQNLNDFKQNKTKIVHNFEWIIYLHQINFPVIHHVDTVAFEHKQLCIENNFCKNICTPSLKNLS